MEIEQNETYNKQINTIDESKGREYLGKYDFKK